MTSCVFVVSGYIDNCSGALSAGQNQLKERQSVRDEPRDMTSQTTGSQQPSRRPSDPKHGEVWLLDRAGCGTFMILYISPGGANVLVMWGDGWVRP